MKPQYIFKEDKIMNRTLCILVWVVITYLTSLNLEAFNLGNFTQLIGLIMGTSLSAIFISTFVTTERELLKLGVLASAVCLYLGALSNPANYFHLYYNVDKYILLQQNLSFITLGTLGAIRSLYLYMQARKENKAETSPIQIVKNLFVEEL